MKTRTCGIHGTELVETHPADVENGPSPHDVFNELLCLECETEWTIAYEESLCIAHRMPIGACNECYVADATDETSYTGRN